MLFKLADNRFPSGPEHDALGQINWFTETAIKIRVVMFFGTLTGCSLFASPQPGREVSCSYCVVINRKRRKGD
jgi:hypothetical protein